jgi:hypothetical protein
MLRSLLHGLDAVGDLKELDRDSVLRVVLRVVAACDIPEIPLASMVKVVLTSLYT